MKSSIKATVTLCSFLFLGCGRAEDPENSATDSLVGGLSSGPCMDAKDWNGSHSHCLIMNSVVPGAPADAIAITFVDDGSKQAFFRGKEYRALQAGLRFLQDRWAQYALDKVQRVESKEFGLTKFEQCILRNTSKDWLPSNSIAIDHANTPEKQVNWALTSLSLLFSKQAKSKTVAYVDAYNEGDSLARAFVGNDRPESGDMNISFNVKFLSTQPVAHIAGTFLHEWLHRKGWTHDATYEGSLITAVTDCIDPKNDTGTTLTGRPSLFVD